MKIKISTFNILVSEVEDSSTKNLRKGNYKVPLMAVDEVVALTELY